MTFVNITALRIPEGAGPEIEKRFAARRRSVDAGSAEVTPTAASTQGPMPVRVSSTIPGATRSVFVRTSHASGPGGPRYRGAPLHTPDGGSRVHGFDDEDDIDVRSDGLPDRPPRRRRAPKIRSTGQDCRDDGGRRLHVPKPDPVADDGRPHLVTGGMSTGAQVHRPEAVRRRVASPGQDRDLDGTTMHRDDASGGKVLAGLHRRDLEVGAPTIAPAERLRVTHPHPPPWYRLALR